MKHCRNIILAILALSAGFQLSAKTFDSPRFAPVTPEVTAQGGSFTAVAEGYNSLFTNPAGFAREEGEFTLLSATAKPYFIPSDDNLDSLNKVMDGDSDGTQEISDLLTENGIGAAGTLGIGYVGNRLGLGVVADLDLYGRGETALGTELDAFYTWGFIGGMGWPFRLGPVDLYAGGDLRFMVRSRTKMAFLDLMENTGGSQSYDVLTGGGLAIDGGFIAEMGPIALGLSMRDIGGTEIDYKSSSIEDIGSIFTFEEGSGVEEAEDNYRIPMSANIGLGYHPDFGRLSWIIDPKFHAEYQHVWYEEEKHPSPWTHVHMGAEIKTLRFISLRAGFNQGYFTAGAGMHLLFLDLNFAYFTRETGRYTGVKPNSGLSVEAALRF